jgi:hypothetical protein
MAAGGARGGEHDLVAARGAALQAGIRAVVAGQVASRADGYAFTLAAIDPASGDVMAALRETAPTATPALAAMERLGRRFEPLLAEALRPATPASP